MIQESVAWMVEGITAPRQSTRRLLDRAPGPEIAVLLVVAGYAIQAFFGVLFFEILFSVPAEVDPAGDGPEIGNERLPALVFHVLSIVFQFLTLGAVVVTVNWLGRAFGGTGTLQGAMIAIAWYFFATSLLSPIFSYSFATILSGGESGLSVLLLFTASAIALWVFANVIAELHRFESAWAVLGTMLGMMVAASVIVAALTGGS